MEGDELTCSIGSSLDFSSGSLGAALLLSEPILSLNHAGLHGLHLFHELLNIHRINSLDEFSMKFIDGKLNEGILVKLLGGQGCL